MQLFLNEIRKKPESSDENLGIALLLYSASYTHSMNLVVSMMVMIFEYISAYQNPWLHGILVYLLNGDPKRYKRYDNYPRFFSSFLESSPLDIQSSPLDTLCQMFTAALLVQALLATAAFAIPTSRERAAARRARRSTGVTRQSKPVNIISSPALTNTSHETFSENWAGAVLVASTVSTLLDLHQVGKYVYLKFIPNRRPTRLSLVPSLSPPPSLLGAVANNARQPGSVSMAILARLLFCRLVSTSV
jgi:hypothetical protein